MKRLLTGDGIRRTRLHDYRGNRIDLSGMRYLPRAVFTTLVFKLTGHRPLMPWLGFRGIRRLDGLIEPSWRILEFGSGTSTIWFAERAGQVLSIEHDAQWFERVRQRLERSGLRNVDLRLHSPEHYASLDGADGSFDLAIVDGLFRTRAAQVAVRAVRSGGWIYLDNCDVLDADHEGARDTLLQAGNHVEYFTDFYPTYIGVNQGMIVQLK